MVEHRAFIHFADVFTTWKAVVSHGHMWYAQSCLDHCILYQLKLLNTQRSNNLGIRNKMREDQLLGDNLSIENATDISQREEVAHSQLIITPVATIVHYSPSSVIKIYGNIPADPVRNIVLALAKEPESKKIQNKTNCRQ